MIFVGHVVVGLLLVYEVIDTIKFVKLLYSLRDIRGESHE
jgi:hypothetical protein